MKKKIIILEHNNGGRLANQLWNFASIYAFCLEKNYECHNFSFFEEKKHKDKKIYFTYCDYNKYFNLRSISIFVKILLSLHLKNNQLTRRINLYQKFVRIIKKKYSKQIIISVNNPFYLPPSKNTNQEQISKLKIIEEYNKIFLCNWFFRNPHGLSKYHQEITNYFKPKKEIQNKNKKIIDNLRLNYKYIVGVHIRQGDYKKEFKKGKLYFNEKEINIILNRYLEKFEKNTKETCFIICSDENVELSHFAGLNVIKNNGNAIEDLFLLAKTDVIIGANSTFGAFASYYGNIPFIVFQKNNIDWKYYINKKNYFENKYLTTVNY